MGSGQRGATVSGAWPSHMSWRVGEAEAKGSLCHQKGALCYWGKGWGGGGLGGLCRPRSPEKALRVINVLNERGF